MEINAGASLYLSKNKGNAASKWAALACEKFIKLLRHFKHFVHLLFFLINIYKFSHLLKKPFFFGFSAVSGSSPRMAASNLRRASRCASFMRSGTCTTSVT